MGQHARSLTITTPEKRQNTCLELSQLEQFHQIVVRPEVERGHAILDLIARGEHEHTCEGL